MITTRIQHDTIKPSAKLTLLTAPTLRPLPQLYKCGLNDIFGVLLIIQGTVRKVEIAIGMAPHELRKGAMITVTDTPHQLRV
jgi:hypothetical protein